MHRPLGMTSRVSLLSQVDCIHKNVQVLSLELKYFPPSSNHKKGIRSKCFQTLNDCPGRSLYKDGSMTTKWPGGGATPSETRTPVSSPRDVNSTLKHTPGVSRKNASKPSSKETPGHLLDSGIHSVYRLQLHAPKPLLLNLCPSCCLQWSKSLLPRPHPSGKHLFILHNLPQLSLLCETSPKWRYAPLL